MVLFWPLHGLILFFSSAVTAILAVVAWRRRTTQGGWLFFLLMVTITEITLASGFEAGMQGQDARVFWSKVEYIGFVSAPLLLPLFVLEYTRQLDRFRGWPVRLAWVIPVITLVLAWTNELHGLIWSSFSAGDPAENIMVYHHGLFYWVYVAFMYLCLILTIVSLAAENRRPGSDHRQVSAMMVAALFPALTGTIYITHLNPIPGLDWFTVGLVVTGVVFAWSIMRHGLLDLVPVARSNVMDQLHAGVIVLDLQQRIVDVNPAACGFASSEKQHLLGQDVQNLLSPEVDLSSLASSDQTIEFAFEHNPELILELQLIPLTDRNGDVVGRLLFLDDITAVKAAAAAVEQANCHLQEQLRENLELRDKLQAQALRDVVTGLFNRRYMEETLPRELFRAHRGRQPVSMLMLDIDHFKQVIDTFGHPQGDRLLQELGQLLTRNCRREDIVCRYGGEEFLVILPGAGAQTAARRAGQLRLEFDNIHLDAPEGDLHATISIGVAEFPQDGETMPEVLRAADQALCQAKSLGRNRFAEKS